jgi:hypothetical protein
MPTAKVWNTKSEEISLMGGGDWREEFMRGKCLGIYIPHFLPFIINKMIKDFNTLRPL